MNKRPTPAILIATIALSAPLCAACSLVDDSAPTLAEIRNATYTGTHHGEVTLRDGEWESEPFVEGGASRARVGLVEGYQFQGDLDGDGNPETAVVLWENSGGTGSYSYVAVMARQNGGIRNIATALIGDRVDFQEGKIEDGNIVLDVLQAGEDDPMCCPSVLATRSWSLKDGALTEGEIEITGTHSTAPVDGSN